MALRARALKLATPATAETTVTPVGAAVAPAIGVCGLQRARDSLSIFTIVRSYHHQAMFAPPVAVKLTVLSLLPAEMTCMWAAATESA